MLTLILLVAVYVPFIIFTISWKLPWEFTTRIAPLGGGGQSVKLEWAGTRCGLSRVI